MLDVFVSSEAELYLLESKRIISVNRSSIYALATVLFAGTAQAAPIPSTNSTTTYHRVQVDGIGIFYREAGPGNAPTIVLLHGFPSSSREFDTLIPLLATKYHLIAPDYPGFGLSDAPSPTAYTYTFDHLAQTMSDFLEKLKITHYTMYLHDYGAPIGFRIILAHPNKLHALISQNGNIYRAGLEPNGPRLRNTGQIPMLILRCSTLFFRSRPPRSGTLQARPIRIATIQIPGSASMLICRGPVSERFRGTCSMIIGPTSRTTRNGRPGSANTSLLPSWSGVQTTLPSSRRVQKPSGGTYRMRRFTCSTLDTSHWMNRQTRLRS